MNTFEDFSTGQTPIEKYYRFHARVYDITRWSFLFKRTALVHNLSATSQPERILEVGCGTGKNLKTLHRTFPDADITGLDLSSTMLDYAAKNPVCIFGNVSLCQASYDKPLKPDYPFDLIVFSYALSMFNPGWDRAIDCAWEDLAPGGQIAVVDFNHSRWHFFRNWMGVNHVRMEGHLMPKLTASFKPLYSKIHQAYSGLWSYFLFIGKK